MTKALKFFAALVLAIPLFAQAQAQRPGFTIYSQPELDQMLAPVALYPDSLLSQVLMAATYPEEVAEAANWSRANPGLQGDDAVRAAEFEDWDPSVKSLVAFPQLLQRMAENPQWTRSLGDAFLAQEPHVMDSVQQLRRRAQAAGTLQSSEQLYVQQQGQTILIQPASPQYVYVPYYDPYVVYGQWWWPAYQPVYWTPWHGYARAYRPGVAVGFWWGAPVRLSVNFFFGNFDWHHRHARIVHPNAYYYRSAARANRTFAASPQRWQNDPQRRAAFAGRQEPQVERREARQAARVQAAQPAATVRTQTQTPAVIQQRFERREERREERRTERQAAPVTAPVQVQPAATVQVQPQAPVTVQQQQRTERREERREERRAQRQAAPVQVQSVAPARAQPQAPAPAAAPPPSRMPATSAPQTPRAERLEQRQEQRQERREQRQELRGQKG